MQQAVPVGTGAMAALLGLELDAAAAVAAEAAQGEVCQAANDNGGGQVVVSGNTAAVERAVEIAKAKGAKRAMMLPVSAPFHCALMQPAADAMAEALGKTDVKPPVVPVVANVLAQPISDPQEIVRRLVEQVTGTVRWRECVGVHGRRGRDDVLRGRLGQGADRPAQAHRRRRDRHGDRHAGRRRGVQGRARQLTTSEREARMFDLTGKTALVTGATGGIGGAIARALHAQGATVALSGTRREALDALAAELGGAPCCPAISPTRTRSRRWFPTPRRRWASSTSWWPMPASPGTTCSSR